MIRNINEKFGDRVEFESVEEMARELNLLGYELPEDGLEEGLDYETFGNLLIAGHEIYLDRSGVGRNFAIVYEDDRSSVPVSEIESQIIDYDIKACGAYKASNGLLYRW